MFFVSLNVPFTVSSNFKLISNQIIITLIESCLALILLFENLDHSLLLCYQRCNGRFISIYQVKYIFKLLDYRYKLNINSLKARLLNFFQMRQNS